MTFAFMKESKKQKIQLSIVYFAGAVIEAARTLSSSESGPAKLFPQEPRSASQHPATIAWSPVREHLRFHSVLCIR